MTPKAISWCGDCRLRIGFVGSSRVQRGALKEGVYGSLI